MNEMMPASQDDVRRTEAGRLPRFAVRWRGPTDPIGVIVADGYWTPWHLAEEALDGVTELRARLAGAEQQAAAAMRERDLLKFEATQLAETLKQVEGTAYKCRQCGHHAVVCTDFDDPARKEAR